MGMWAPKLYSFDLTCDVRDTYLFFLQEQCDDIEAYRKTVLEYSEIINTDEEGLFWIALAETQWQAGRLMLDVKQKALHFICDDEIINLCDMNRLTRQEWVKTLQGIRTQLNSPTPPKKVFDPIRKFNQSPWNTGDLYAYRFHTKKSKEEGMFNKYIVFQKMGCVEYYRGVYYSIIQIFNRLFDDIPMIQELENISILPLVYPPGIKGTPNTLEKYAPSFEWYEKAIMLYDKESDFPQKHFFFIGNIDLHDSVLQSYRYTDFFWQQNKMEDWIIDYYVEWEKYLSNQK